MSHATHVIELVNGFFVFGFFRVFLQLRVFSFCLSPGGVFFAICRGKSHTRMSLRAAAPAASPASSPGPRPR